MMHLACWLVGCLFPQEPDGWTLFRQGKYPEAATSFRIAAESSAGDADLQYNLALASWRAGQLDAAELAIEKYAALSGRARVDLHAGLLGAVRFDEAQGLAQRAAELLQPAAGSGAPTPAAPAAAADPLPLLEQALDKVEQARQHFVRGALANRSPELVRNTERALRFRDELQQQIEELKKRRQQQQGDQRDNPQDGKQDDQRKSQQDDKQGEAPQHGDSQAKPKPAQDPQQTPESKPGEQSQPSGDAPQQGKPAGQQPPEQPAGEPNPHGGEGAPDATPQERPEPKADAPQSTTPKPATKPEQQESAAPDASTGSPAGGTGQPRGADGAPRHDAPGEGDAGHQLSPEQAQKLLQALHEADQALRDYRIRATRNQRRSAARDW